MHMWNATKPYFNPHHPQGGDVFGLGGTENQNISIHTTRKVVTLAEHEKRVTDASISIHTTRKVVTELLFYDMPGSIISIHTTRKVVT